jgi:2-amino-4-hydroxy-6-hydroxymethyldihydropteridine diphosphokinase
MPRDDAAARPARRAILGLGTNLGDREGNLRRALASLDERGLVSVSGVYETEPLGGPEGQGAYLNLVVVLETDASPHDLLAICRELEADAGRVRAARWGPRTLDVAVLWVDGVELDDDELTVPHPRMWERRFVVEPLREVAPDLVDDATLAAASGAVRRVADIR